MGNFLSYFRKDEDEKKKATNPFRNLAQNTIRAGANYLSGGVLGSAGNTANFLQKRQSSAPKQTSTTSTASRGVQQYSQPAGPKLDLQAYRRIIGQKEEKEATPSYGSLESRYRTAAEPRASKMMDFYKKQEADYRDREAKAAEVERAGAERDIELGRKGVQDFRTATEGDIAIAQERTGLAKTEREQQAARDIEAQRKQQRLQNVKRQAEFAALGTLESGGYFGYAGQAQAADVAALEKEAEIRMAKANDIQELNLGFQEFQNAALLKVQEALSNFESFANDTRTNLSLSQIQREQRLADAYGQLQETLYGIEQNVEDKAFQYGIKDYEVQREAAEDNAGTKNLSAGIDQLEALFFGAEGEAPLSLDQTAGISGGLSKAGQSFRTTFDQGFQDRVTAYKNMQALVLGLINKAREAGTLNEGEFETMIANMPNQYTSTEAAKAYFSNVKNLLVNKSGSAYEMGAGGQVQMRSSDGSLYTVDQSEVQEARANGWEVV